jgi:hypothetical protein
MCIKKESNQRDSENAGIVVPPSETNYTNVPNQNENEAIYFDPFFLRLIDICTKIGANIGKFINYIQFVRKAASFNCLSTLICWVLLFYFSFNILESYSKVKSSLPVVDEKINMLQKILKYEINKSFLNDIGLYSGLNKNYMNDHYASLIKFLDNEMIHFTIQNNKIESFINHCSNLSIFIAALPFILNLSSWAPFVALITALTSRVLIDQSIGFSLGMMLLINICIGVILLTIHYIKLRLFFNAVLNENK